MKKIAIVVTTLAALLSGCVAYEVPAPGPRHHAHDQDRDGVRDRNDRDRDGDGVPNRADRRPDNPGRY